MNNSTEPRPGSSFLLWGWAYVVTGWSFLFVYFAIFHAIHHQPLDFAIFCVGTVMSLGLSRTLFSRAAIRDLRRDIWDIHNTKPEAQ